jgi:tellurite methyltransferase
MNSKTKWNRKYLERITIIEEEPRANARLKSLSASLKGGSALDLACGLGGNSFLLADLGYQVQALDVSDVAVDFICERAIHQQLPIKPVVCDLTDLTNISLDRSSFDLVVLTYYLDRSIFPFVKSIVNDDGYFFMETFYRSSKLKHEGVSNQYKLESQELLGEFREWKVLFYEENEEEGRQTILCQKQVTH